VNSPLKHMNYDPFISFSLYIYSTRWPINAMLHLGKLFLIEYTRVYWKMR